MTTQKRRLFFIVSPSPRSGSTFLLKCINSHSLCEGKAYYENYVLSKMLDTLDWLDDNETMKNNFLINHPANNVENIRHFVLKSMVNESPLMGVKFTHFRNFKFLKMLFPEAKIVVIQRNPLDTYCSFKDLTKKLGEGPISGEAWFQKYISTFYQSLRSLEGVHLLNYENLIENFEEEMGKVWDHLDVPRETVDPRHLFEVFKERHFSDVAKESEKQLDARGICATRMNRYTRELDAEEVLRMKTLMRELNQKTVFDGQKFYGNLYEGVHGAL